MNTTLIYLLQVNVGIVLFYLFYRLFFAGDTFWKTRRLYLLLSFAASFTYPLLSIESWLSQQEPVQTTLVRIITLPEIVISPTQKPELISVETLLTVVYLLVVLGLLVRMLVQLVALLRLRWAGNIAFIQGVKVISVDREMSPFSFFGAVFINPKLHTETETQQILAHELTHVRQWHSVDVLVGELLSIAFWINPAVWLLKREIRQNLEFLADNQVLRSGYDPKHYQYHLLQLSYQIPQTQLGNQFNVSPLKKRIIMMNKQNSNKAAVLKYMLIVPLVLSLVLVANAQSVVKKAKKVVAATEQTSAKSVSDSTKKLVKTTMKFVAPVMKKNEVVATDDKVFDVVDKMPEYPGGLNAMMNYMVQNVKYPAAAIEAGAQGRIFVRFIVNKEGKVTNAKVLYVTAKASDVKSTGAVSEAGKSDGQKARSKEGYEAAGKAMDAEALRVVNAMPDWIPGEQNGKKVAVYYTLPIQFKLDGDSKNAAKTEKEALNIKNPDGTRPLYILDGKEISESDFKEVQADIIQSVNVLKGASGTAIYGDKAKNGVVIITTKK
jgi:TonB-dependent SusC/RagA subfamily outer membrane receptor